jgi:hypothetical protein
MIGTAGKVRYTEALHTFGKECRVTVPSELGVSTADRVQPMYQPDGGSSPDVTCLV